MIWGAKANLFSLCAYNWGTTCWSSSVTCIYCANAKGKCSVKLNGELAVIMFSLEAYRIKADGERQPGSYNGQLCRINPVTFLTWFAGESSHLSVRKMCVSVVMTINHISSDAGICLRQNVSQCQCKRWNGDHDLVKLDLKHWNIPVCLNILVILQQFI